MHRESTKMTVKTGLTVLYFFILSVERDRYYYIAQPVKIWHFKELTPIKETQSN